jgi:hypothetical protein
MAVCAHCLAAGVNDAPVENRDRLGAVRGMGGGCCDRTFMTAICGGRIQATPLLRVFGHRPVWYPNMTGLLRAARSRWRSLSCGGRAMAAGGASGIDRRRCWLERARGDVALDGWRVCAAAGCCGRCRPLHRKLSFAHLAGAAGRASGRASPGSQTVAQTEFGAVGGVLIGLSDAGGRPYDRGEGYLAMTAMAAIGARVAALGGRAKT